MQQDFRKLVYTFLILVLNLEPLTIAIMVKSYIVLCFCIFYGYIVDSSCNNCTLSKVLFNAV